MYAIRSYYGDQSQASGQRLEQTAFREGSNVFQTVANHFDNKDFVLTLWKEINKDKERRRFWAQFIGDKKRPNGNRITSYNVCYTKLLRLPEQTRSTGLLLAA